MDGTGSTASIFSQRGCAKQSQPSPKSWASFGVFSPVYNGDQVWLEELIGPSFNQSSPSSSPGGSRRSSEGTGSLYSWSSGVTCLLHSSIKKQSHEVFQARQREERRWGKLEGCTSRGPHGRVDPQAEQGGGGNDNKLHAWPETGGLCQGRSSAWMHAKQPASIWETILSLQLHHLNPNPA